MMDILKGPRARTWVVACGASAATLGAVSLFGWITGIEWMVLLAPGVRGMKANSALAFLCAGLSLVLTGSGRRGRIAGAVLAGIAAVVGAVEAASTLFDLNWNIDRVLVSGHYCQLCPPGRVSLRTALTCTFDALALSLWHAVQHWRAVMILAAAAGGLVYFSVAADFYAGSLTGQFGGVPVLPWNSLAAGAFLTIGILSLDEEHGVAATITRPGVCGRQARLLLTGSLLIPLGLGWLRLSGQRHQWFDTEFGVAILVSSTATVLAGLAWWNNDSLFRFNISSAKARAELRHQADLIDRSNDAIITMDSDRRILGWNRGAEQLYGWTAAEARGQVIHELLATEGETTMPEVWQKIADSGQWAGELRQKRRDGQVVICDSRQVKIQGDETSAVRILEINRDVTGARRMEAQLRQSQRLESIGQLAGGIAHDFNNLLTVINGYSALLAADRKLSADARESVAEIVTSGKRAAAITRQLLAFSRRQISVREYVNLSAEVSAMERMLRRLIGQNVGLEVRATAGDVTVFMDRGNLEQVILNLVLNARDAVGSQGQIQVETSLETVTAPDERAHLSLKPGLYAVLAVIDNGSGMTPEVQARIFEPFFTTKEPGRGTGLGLSTVHGIVEQNDGVIEIHSEVGKGSVFRVLLPVSDVPRPEAELHPEAACPAGTESVLLAEDEEPLRKYFCRILEQNGYRVQCAGNGREALDLLRAGPRPDLVLTDIVMPELDGIQLAAQAQELYPGIRVVHMSGYSDQLAGSSGLEGFLQKPFTAPDLLTKIRAVLDEPC